MYACDRNPYYYTRPVPRRFTQVVDFDDYLQLQLLLQQKRERCQAIIAEQERRRAAEAEYRRRLEERQRLEVALSRLYYVGQQSQQQRLEEERRIRREQRYRAELMAALKAAQEEEYRRRVLAAIERQKQWESARLKREESVKSQCDVASNEEEQKRQVLEDLLKHVFGQHPDEKDEQDDEEVVPTPVGDEALAWKRYYRPEPRKPMRKIPIHFADEAPVQQGQGQERLELKQHVVPLEVVLDGLLTKPAEQEYQQEPEEDSAQRRQAFDNILKQAIESAETRRQQQQEEERQQQLAEDRAFENFLNQTFQQQDQSQPSAFQSEKATTSPAPVLSEEEAAAKIQTWFKSAHDSHAISQVTHQLSALAEISAQLNRIQTEIASLADVNRRWLHYEDEIMKVLVRLDTIESHGSDVVRDRRKELVARASTLLDRLDEYKHAELERSSASSIQEDDGKAPITESQTDFKPEPFTIPELELAADELPKSEEQPKPIDEPTVRLSIPGHPHPENPNATTVDDADEFTPSIEVADPILAVKGDESAVKVAKEENVKQTTEKSVDEDFVVV